jgi:glycosyltransferase involved in cell wall biosynthesis
VTGPTRVSVVLGVRGGAGVLAETLDSVLAQEGVALELILVVDGHLDPSAEAEVARHGDRLHMVRRPPEGLTLALIAGCAEARGAYIARVDAGDRMEPGRLARQAEVLDQHPACVWTACATAVTGPEWEPLGISRGRPEDGGEVEPLPENPEQGLSCDIPHHGAAMFRRADYLACGGYRAEFYYGQDWDLWYRLAERGRYYQIPEVLYTARLFPHGISMRKWRQQRRIAECSRGAFVARRLGRDQSPFLERARAIRPPSRSGLGEGLGRLWWGGDGAYFIGEALRRQRHPHARRYLVESLRHAPLQVRGYVRLIQSGLGF